MYKASVRRAYYGLSPHLWPFYLWGKLVKWSLLSVVGAAGLFYVIGEAPFDVTGLLVFAYTVGVGAILFGLVPTVILTLCDVVLVRRPAHRPAEFDPRPPRFDRQRKGAWAGYAATIGAAFGVAYSVVYLNAFASESSLSALAAEMVPRLALGGAAAGWFVAAGVNRLHSFSPATTLEQQRGRGAALWAATTVGLGAMAYFTIDPTLHHNLLPAALLAVFGAVALPQPATTPPIDLAVTPPPPPATASFAPSPRPYGPEGGAGEGATRDQSAAPAASTRKDDQWTTP